MVDMEKPVQRKPDNKNGRDRDGALDLDALLHPAQAFAHPADVVNDHDLTLSEKRAILASWATDACAAEAVPVLQQPADAAPQVRFDDVVDALRILERQIATSYKPQPHYRRVLARRIPGVFGRKSPGDDDRGPTLN
jgi:hypothetical protein